MNVEREMHVTHRSSFIVHRLLLFAAALLPACRRPEPSPAKVYTGPTQPMVEVVQAINANNIKVPSIWAQLEYNATIVDKERGTSNVVSGDGSLLYRRPMSLLLRGQKDVAGTIFTIGSNDTEFWMIVTAGADTTWWGHYANIEKPCCRKIPVRPDLVLAVLGVGLFDVDFLESPVPVMRFNNDADCYMFVWNIKRSDRWTAQKEIWFDRATKQPRRVYLFDENGRVILRAYLRNHGPLEVPGMPRDQWPQVARHYELYFPDEGSRMTFDFTNAATEHNGSPRPAAFHRPEEPGTKEVIQIDRDCADNITSAAQVH
ncbi:MAG TPA: hypothetical protein VLI90_09515 [Tepidisphaeraceae bacterium]|nr:hypothetical protein [Tepidisphaeraceae bacterium]